MSSSQSRPPISFDKESIVSALEGLWLRDPKCRLFGAASHNYTLNPPLPVAEVEAFERKHNITLPDDYKYFLTEVGNGGAGPAYGVLPLGVWAFTDELHKIDDPEWHIDGEPGRPFQHTEAWNLPDNIRAREPDPTAVLPPEEEDRQMEEWNRVQQAAYAHVMDGALPICDRGCGLMHWLVVNGSQKGFIWNDNLSGIEPLRDPSGRPLTFADWYLAWLDTTKNQPLPVFRPHKHRQSVLHFFPEWVLGVTFGVGIFGGMFLAIALHVKRRSTGALLVSGSAIVLLLLVTWLDRWLCRRQQRPTGAREGQTVS